MCDKISLQLLGQKKDRKKKRNVDAEYESNNEGHYKLFVINYSLNI